VLLFQYEGGCKTVSWEIPPWRTLLVRSHHQLIPLMSVAKPPPSFCYRTNLATVPILLPCQLLLPCQSCYRANFVTVPVIGREKNCYKKVKGRRKNMPRGKLKHKKEQLRRWKKRPLTQKEKKFNKKTKTRNYKTKTKNKLFAPNNKNPNWNNSCPLRSLASWWIETGGFKKVEVKQRSLILVVPLLLLRKVWTQDFIRLNVFPLSNLLFILNT